MRNNIKSCLTLIACTLALAKPAAAEGKHVVFLDGPVSDKFVAAMTRGFTEPAKTDGLNVTLLQTPFDPALQSQQLDDAIAQKADLIVLMTMSQKAIVPALTRAKAAKIPVLLINTPIDDPTLYTAFVGENPTWMGEGAGKAMGDALKAAGRTTAKVAVVAGSMDEGLAPFRVAGFKKELAAYPGVTVVAVEETHWSPAEAERAAGQLLARFAGQGGLDGIYGMNDVMANGVIEAAESAGVKVGMAKGDLIVVGGNCMAPGMVNIDHGKMQGTTSVVPTNIGKIAEQTAVQILAGKPFTKDQPLPIEVINKTNIEKYRKSCSY